MYKLKQQAVGLRGSDRNKISRVGAKGKEFLSWNWFYAGGNRKN